MSMNRERILKGLGTFWSNTRTNTRKVLLALPYVLLAAGVVLSIVSGVRLFQIQDKQKSQIAAEIWSGESGITYRQVSCFARGQKQIDGGPDQYLTSDYSLSLTEIEKIRESLDQTISSSFGLEDEDETPNQPDKSETEDRFWIDAYSASCDATVTSLATDVSDEIPAEVNLTGVGGEFYVIHPMKMESGAFLQANMLDTKKIVLDTELSFELFGTYQVIGRSVMIGQREYVIVGVVRHASTEIDQKTQGDKLRAYIPFAELAYLLPADDSGLQLDQQLPGTLDGSSSPRLDSIAITCYEAVLPNRIKGIAMANLLTAFETSGKMDKNFLFVDNTERFSPLRLWDMVFPAGETQYQRQGFTLPFWESSAQMAESTSVFWWSMVVLGSIQILWGLLTIYIRLVKRKFA